MTEDEVMRCVREAVDRRYGTVVLQSGEDHDTDWLAGLIDRIKSETSLAVTISTGERTREELRSEVDVLVSELRELPDSSLESFSE